MFDEMMDSQKIINFVISIFQHVMDLFHQIVQYVIQNIEQWIYCLTCIQLDIMILDNQNVHVFLLNSIRIPLFTITILVINVLIIIKKVVLFVLQNLILEYYKEISANLLMLIIKSKEFLSIKVTFHYYQSIRYIYETCKSQAEKCFTFPLNPLCILDSVKRCFYPEEFYDKQDSIVSKKCHFKCKSCDGKIRNNCLTCDSYAKRELINNEWKWQSDFFQIQVQECTSDNINSKTYTKY
ncbi:unnamed protein product [Paramecium primaurelia]|uniref:Transmembrane protein n=1 Tax=Paramecium primaurelia TaxID=5886 RepID=A0A8S1PX53_PARPR|nr:unnamed protein product [Paramecium primaurelia]